MYLYAVLSTTNDQLLAFGTTEESLIEQLGETHECFYQAKPWTDEDIARIEAGGWHQINPRANYHNSVVEFEVYEVPDGLRYGSDIHHHFAEREDLPPSIKTLTLFKAVMKTDQ